MSLQIKVEPSEGREGGGWTNPNNLFIQYSLAQLQGVCGGGGWEKGGWDVHVPFFSLTVTQLGRAGLEGSHEE